MYNIRMDDDNRPISRRKLFRDGFSFLGQVVGEFASAANIIPEEVDTGAWDPLEPKRGLLRPPGAVEEAEFMTLCKPCDDCIKACPEGTLFPAPVAYGPTQGTPIFKPASKPCFLCTELHCIKACTTSALKMVESISKLSMGIARIDPEKCITHEGKECSYCIDFCPLAGEAIMEIGGRPLILADYCVGCGLCEYHCRRDAGRRAITTLGPLSEKTDS